MSGNHSWQLIPTHDEIGQRIKVGDDAILFSPNGIHYEGNIVRIGGKRCFQVKNSFRIGGIGSCRIMRSKEVYED